MSEVNEFEDQAPELSNKGSELDFLVDIPLTVTVELGRSEATLNDIMKLGAGSVIEIDKLAGEPLEVFVNSKLAASGEVVVVNERYGIRMTDIISPIDKVEEDNQSA